MFREVEAQSILKSNHFTSLFFSAVVWLHLLLLYSLTRLSSVLALSEEEKKNIKNKFFPFPSVEQFNLPKRLLHKAALSLHPGFIWFPFLDINL